MPLLVYFFVHVIYSLLHLVVSRSSIQGGPLRHLEFLEYRIEQTSDNLLKLEIHNFNSTFNVLLKKTLPLFQPRDSSSFSNLQKYKSIIDFDVYEGIVLKKKEFVNNEMKKATIDHMLESYPTLNWARILVNKDKDIRGIFTYETQEYNIEKVDVYSNVKRNSDINVLDLSERPVKDKKNNLIIYRGTDMYSNRDEHVSLKTKKRIFQLNRRQDLNPKKCINKEQDLYIGVVVDCYYMKKFKTKDEAIEKIFSDWNAVSGIYTRTFNLNLVIVSLDISDECQIDGKPWNRKCENGYTLNSKLSDFSVWTQNLDRDTSLWHLMTDCFIQGEAGLAYVDTFCAPPDITGNKNTGVSTISNTPWKTIAHEIGHNLGANHDCDKATCSGFSKDKCTPCENNCDCKGSYIMTPVSGSEQSDDFSSGSIQTICDRLKEKRQCFDNTKKRRALKPGVCGNKIVENGEECDCGSKEECKKSLCCTDKCTYKEKAKCDDASEKCCNNCNIKPKGDVCRKSYGECDIEEKCSGSSGRCPEDSFVENGTPCEIGGPDELNCANGYCTSMDKQCKSLRTTTKMVAAQKSKNRLVNTCELICLNQEERAYKIDGNFIDGTKCGENLYCNSGNCEGALYDKLADLVKRNLIFSIIVMVGLLFMLVSVVLCLFRFFSRKISACRKNPSSQ